MEIIKKFPNGKLYITIGNTEPTGYVTLPDLLNIIRKGKEIRVIDNVNGEDITVKVLKPALVELELSLEQVVGLIRE